jgi:hypothetical protein
MARYATAPQVDLAARPEEEIVLLTRLAADTSGKLRNELLDGLAVAAVDIETALSDERDAGQAGILRKLLQAVRLSERAVVDAWDSLHG